MKGQVRQAARTKDMSQFHSGMAALRSIDEHASGWCRAYGATCQNKPALFTVAGAALVLHQLPI
jgi:hypothetical protein